MRKSVEQSSRPDEGKPQRNLSEAAAGYFIAVSFRYKASTVAQSIALALMLQDSEQDPRQLGQALKDDPVQLSELARAANRAHAAREGRKTAIDKLNHWAAGRTRPPQRVTQNGVKEIVEDVFTEKVPEIIANHPDDLKRVLKLYPRRIKPGQPARIVQEDYIMVKEQLSRLMAARENTS